MPLALHVPCYRTIPVRYLPRPLPWSVWPPQSRPTLEVSTLPWRTAPGTPAQRSRQKQWRHAVFSDREVPMGRTTFGRNSGWTTRVGVVMLAHYVLVWRFKKNDFVLTESGLFQLHPTTLGSCSLGRCQKHNRWYWCGTRLFYRCACHK